MFKPTRFYRTEDFRSSSRRPKPGYVPDCLLYAGDFDEISIHLFPKIHRIRVRNAEESRRKLSILGFETDADKRCYIFANREAETQIMEFEASVYIFDDCHFTKTPSNEYISREPVEAIGSESYTMQEILRSWRIQLIPVDSVPELSGFLTDAGVAYSYQT
ncbi:MAG: hypothetical protein OXU79_13390 [Gemmatimonadota bacterium]|nr:hypothetical protein [Gemmatimonadota bacterium]